MPGLAVLFHPKALDLVVEGLVTGELDTHLAMAEHLMLTAEVPDSKRFPKCKVCGERHPPIKSAPDSY